MLFSVTPDGAPLSEQRPNVCPVTDSVALPGRDGFPVTLAVNELDLQVAVKEPRAKLALARLARLAFSTAPFLTAGPPFFPIVSTGLAAAACALAAYAAPAGMPSTMTLAAA